MKLSVIVPCKNEEGNVKGIYEKVSNTLKDIKYELIYINDGSDDNTIERLREIYAEDMLHVKVLSFSRNFKKEAAMLAGLEHASGEYSCIIDGDLQQNPKYLLEMMDFLDNNSDYDEVAMTVKERKNENKLMVSCKNTFYKLIDKWSDVHFENAASDFRMFRCNVKDAIISLKEKNRFLKGIFSYVGFNIKYLPYEVEERNSGNSSFGFKASVNYAIDGILAFSTKPLKIAYSFGILMLLSSFIFLITMLILNGLDIVGFTAIYALIFLLLLISGVQFMVIGVIGEYLAKVYIEVKDRPTYVVKEKMGFNDETIL